ncbi:MAG: Slp family lipoprotein [Deltaproteobacteria bacterium]|nr:Slp family lipoprotein [Deltaproteobacteria bacterium]
MLFGCAKAFPPETMDTVDRDIRFIELQKNPPAFEGKSVLLGGVIIEPQTFSEKTILVVSQRELDSNQKPVENDPSQGRFMVSAAEFLDPAIYRKGRAITVTGQVAGEVVQPIDGVPYRYPLIQKESLHLWPAPENIRSEPSFRFGINFGFGF